MMGKEGGGGGGSLVLPCMKKREGGGVALTPPHVHRPHHGTTPWLRFIKNGVAEGMGCFSRSYGSMCVIRQLASTYQSIIPRDFIGGGGISMFVICC